MGTIQGSDLPRPIRPGAEPPTAGPTPPTAGPTPPTPPAQAAPATHSSRAPLIVAGVVLVLVVVLVAVVAVVAVSRSSSPSSPATAAADAVGKAMGVKLSGDERKCLGDSLVAANVDAETFASNATATADAVTQCVDQGKLASVAGANSARAYNVDAACVEENVANADTATVNSYLVAYFGQDGTTISNIEQTWITGC